jgi:hypothetical protein
MRLLEVCLDEENAAAEVEEEEEEEEADDADELDDEAAVCS